MPAARAARATRERTARDKDPYPNNVSRTDPTSRRVMSPLQPYDAWW